MKTTVWARAGPLLLVLAMLAVPVQAQAEPGITIPETDLIVYESPYKVGSIEPAKTTMTVQLDKAPSAKVVLNLQATPAGQVTLSKTQLTFTSTTAQTVTITAIDDDVEEDLVTTVTISITPDVESEADEYDDVTASVLVSVIDNDGADLIVSQTGGGTQVSEEAGQRTDTFSVVLGRRPLHNVVVAIDVPEAAQADINVLPEALTFRPSNWNVPQTVTVSAIDDDIAEGTEIKQITVAVDTSVEDGETVASQEYLSVAAKTVTVTVLDNDLPGFVVTQSGGSTVTTEAAQEDEDGNDLPHDDIKIRLAHRPQGNVKVQVSSGDTSEVLLRKGTGAFVASVELTYTATNWNTDQTIELQGVDDDLHDGHQDVPVTISIIRTGTDPVWHSAEDHVITVRNLDNEKSVLVDPTSFELDEGDDDTYSISLTLRPEATVTVRIDAGDGLSTDKKSVAFSPTDWQDARVVRVTAVDDAVRTGDREVTITHTIESNDLDYADKATVAPVTVAITDDERFDLATANRALQQTVHVSRSGDDSVVTWDIGVVDGDPVGVQVWRASSPFAIVISLDDDAARYLAQRFVDVDRDAGDMYIVTAYFGPSEDEGRFPVTAALSRVPGYLGMSQAELEALAASADSGGLSPGAMAAIGILALVVLIVIVVIVVLVARRAPREEEPDVDVRADEWEQAGWHVEPRPQFVKAKQEAWAPAQAPKSQAWTASSPAVRDEELSWEEPAEPVEPRAGGAWPGADQTFHLTCPHCRHDFDAVGKKPLKTRCPNCGVEGTLR